MQIHIEATLPGASTSEWVLIELQGDLDSRSNKDAMKGKYIGDLHFTKKGIPILIVGHHILYGKVVEMDKPILALQKDMGTQLEQSVEYAVKGVIKKKLLFKSRPKPIIVLTSKNE